MAHIDYYFSTLSPFVYLADTRLEQIAAKYGSTIAYKPLDIAALFGRTGGVLPKDRHPCLLYTSPSPRDRTRPRMPSSA